MFQIESFRILGLVCDLETVFFAAFEGRFGFGFDGVAVVSGACGALLDDDSGIRTSV